METRKVQMTGGSTYTVSLPKTWATDNDVSSGTTVEFYPEGDELLLTPEQETRRQEGSIDISGLEDEQIFRATLRSPRAVEELGVSREDCFDFHSSARQLERIADHAVKISDIALKLGDLPADVADAIHGLHAEAGSVFEQSMDALFAEEADEANRLGHDALAAVVEIDEHTRKIDDKLRDLEPAQAQSLGLIVDSLSRSADYGGNIAETALQKAAPRP